MYYTLFLPVFKQGDDLNDHLSSCEGSPQAFLKLSEQYKAAAEICDIIYNNIKNISNIEIDAGCHHIGIKTNSRKIQKLVQDGILIKDI